MRRGKGALLPGRCRTPEVSESLGLGGVRSQRELPLPPERAPRTKGRRAAPPAGAQTPSVRRGEASEREAAFPPPVPLNALRKTIPSPAGADPPSGSGWAHVDGSLMGASVWGRGCGTSGSLQPGSGVLGAALMRAGCEQSRHLRRLLPRYPRMFQQVLETESSAPLSLPPAARSSLWGQGEGPRLLSEPLLWVWNPLRWC